MLNFFSKPFISSSKTCNELYLIAMYISSAFLNISYTYKFIECYPPIQFHLQSNNRASRICLKQSTPAYISVRIGSSLRAAWRFSRDRDFTRLSFATEGYRKSISRRKKSTGRSLVFYEARAAYRVRALCARPTYLLEVKITVNNGHCTFCRVGRTNREYARRRIPRLSLVYFQQYSKIEMREANKSEYV